MVARASWEVRLRPFGRGAVIPPVLRLLFALVANAFLLLVLPFRLWRRRRAARPHGWVHLIVDGPLFDLPRPKAHLAELFKSKGQKQELSLHRLGLALEELAADDAARGLLVTLRSVGGGAARLRTLRSQLETLRARGKQVVVHLPHGASLRELTIAAAAHQIWLDPAAGIAPLGVAASIPYVGDGLARAGIQPEVLARGRYKTAAENLIRTEMSDAQREQLEALLDDLFDDAVIALAEGRGVDRARVQQWVEQSPWAACDALEQGIVDALVTDEEIEERLRTWPQAPPPRAASPSSPTTSPATDRTASAEAPAPSNADTGKVNAGKAGAERLRSESSLVHLGEYVRRRRIRYVRVRPKPYVAVIDVHGAIVGEARPGAAVAAERPLVQAIERARRDPRARAIVLHVDSRGGSALASARIRRAVLRARMQKPVVAYFSDVAASGGYLIGVAAQKIVAQPVTLTGSIGVVAAKPVVAELLSRFGVHLETVKRGQRVDMFSLARGLTLDERAAFERELEVTYEDFLRSVAEGRGRSVEEVRAVAEGRVWSGRAALREGLIDRLGGFDAALDEARALVGVPGLEPRRVSSAGWSAMLGASSGLEGRAPFGLARFAPWAGAAEQAWEPLGEANLLAAEGCRVLAHCGVTILGDG